MPISISGVPQSVGLTAVCVPQNMQVSVASCYKRSHIVSIPIHVCFPPLPE